MSHTPIRYGIIGTGMMGCEHIRNLLALPGTQITALADPHEDSRRQGQIACGEENEVEVYSDYQDLVARAPVDAVVIASPNHTHAEVLQPIFDSGLHVLVEKPMCTTIEDSRAIMERAAHHPGVFWVGLEYRYMTSVARFLARLREGVIGELKMLFIREHRFPFLRKVGDWNRFNRNTGGTLVEKCCHFFDLMNLAMGCEAVRVQASGGQDVNHLDESYHGETPDILDNAFVIVDYENGARACLDLCMFAEGSRFEQELVATGDQGKLECTVPGDELIRCTRQYRDWTAEPIDPNPQILHTGLHHGASYLEHVDFLAAIQNNSRALVTAQEGMRSVAIGIAAHRSIEEGRAIDMRADGLAR